MLLDRDGEMELSVLQRPLHWEIMSNEYHPMVWEKDIIKVKVRMNHEELGRLMQGNGVEKVGRRRGRERGRRKEGERSHGEMGCESRSIRVGVAQKKLGNYLGTRGSRVG